MKDGSPEARQAKRKAAMQNIETFNAAAAAEQLLEKEPDA